MSEHVTDRALTTPAVLDQEARLLAWAEHAIPADRGNAASIDAPHLTDTQARAASAVAGDAELVLVVGPAGTGKTTTLAAAVEALHRHRSPVIGLAPSGKAADVLAVARSEGGLTVRRGVACNHGPRCPSRTITYRSYPRRRSGRSSAP